MFSYVQYTGNLNPSPMAKPAKFNRLLYSIFTTPPKNIGNDGSFFSRLYCKVNTGNVVTDVAVLLSYSHFWVLFCAMMMISLLFIESCAYRDASAESLVENTAVSPLSSTTVFPAAAG
jgi:hypothetical protein